MAKKIIIKGLSISYYTQGNPASGEKTLVFLPGWQSEARHLEPIWSRCEDCVAIDLPGFGGSDIPPSSWSVTEYADFLGEFLAKLNVANPILVGHSFGGCVIIKFIARGGHAQKIILIDSAGIRKSGFKIIIYKYLAKVFKLFFSLPFLRKARQIVRAKLYELIDSADYIQAGPLTEIYQKVIREDLQDEMRHINLPVVLIWGAQDKDTPLAQGETMQKIFPQAQLYVIEQAGHFPFIDKPSEFNQVFFSQINDN